MPQSDGDPSLDALVPRSPAELRDQRVIRSSAVRRHAPLLALLLLVACSGQRHPAPAVATRPPDAGAAPDGARDTPREEVAPVASRGRRASNPPDCGDPDEPCGPNVGSSIYQNLLDAAASQVLLAAPRPRAAHAWPSWDRRIVTPAMRAVGDAAGITGREWAAISRNGFAVLRRARYDSPYHAYKDIYRTELPLFVSADSVLHAAFRGHEGVIERLEPHLRGAVMRSVRRAHETLAAMRGELPDDAVRDLDLYLSVAIALDGDGDPATLSPALSAEAARLARAVRAAAEVVPHAELFGRVRVMDYTAFAPRGPYADSPERQRWFRAASWLSRVEFNVVSRDCRSSHPGAAPDPEETPREALDAFALAAVFARAQQLDAVTSASAAWRTIAGPREDASPAELERIRAEAGVASLRAPDAFARLSAAIGDRFPRTARTHPMPQHVRRLPVIATTLGVGAVPDAAATRPLVHDEIEGRFLLGAADVVYAMGHEPAGRLLAGEFARHPRLREGFGRAREAMRRAGEGDGVYDAWLSALLTLAPPAQGVVPSFMATPAWSDFRTNTLAVGYGQLRHANVLYAATSYDGESCRIPDAWVEPVPALFAALRVYYERLGALIHQLYPEGADSGAGPWLEEVSRDLRVLERIARDELAGHELTEAQRRFLGYVAEVLPSTEGAPTHTGWYVEMFPEEADAMVPSAFVADYYASVNDPSVSYVGSNGTVLGAFVVDRGGAPRLMVGPVADGYEYRGPLTRRLDDAHARELSPSDRTAPWATSYALDPVATPRLAFMARAYDGERPAGVADQWNVRPGAAPGMLTIEYLSRHRRVLARGSALVGARAASVVVRWLPGMAPRRDEGDDDGSTRAEREEAEVCGYRLRHGSWVMTQSTDNYPMSIGCDEADLGERTFGGPPRAGGDEE